MTCPKNANRQSNTTGVGGFFISFEGPEGSGKTTQSVLLNEYLGRNGYRSIYTREPGGTNVGDQIREVLLDPLNKDIEDETELLLYGAARVEHLKKRIIPNLQKNKIVICDRYEDSTFAYQGFGRGINLDIITSLRAIVAGKMEPDLTLFLDVVAEQGLKRKFPGEDGRCGADRIEMEQIDFHRRVRMGYVRLAEMYPWRILRVNGNQPVDVVHTDVVSIVLSKLDERGRPGCSAKQCIHENPQ